MRCGSHDADASREHALLTRDLDGVLCRDLDSKNGVYIGGRRVEGERRLEDRDVIVIGATELLFDDPARVALSRLLSAPEQTRIPAGDERGGVGGLGTGTGRG